MKLLKKYIAAVFVFSLIIFSCKLDNTVPEAPEGGTVGGPVETVYTVVNGGFESGSLIGWTVLSGDVSLRTSSPDAYEGTYYIYGSNTPEFELSQEIDLTADGISAADIDSGSVEFIAEGYRASWNASDAGEFRLEFLDENRVELSSVSSGLEVIIPEMSWVSRSVQADVPADTRYVNIVLHGYRHSGSNNDGYFDLISARSITE